ncbi:hypothetical protein [Leisingera daeponensis]|uniref:hypothetical protein n=1 Tax=Leisingera daeponensis TaxID=405746 RepID=UPI001C982E19|nr:hypothetical protein [Leisingera daeponensis]MBY6059426.1 NTP transferase domain-containing protein [Leisingera daeponensis]
MIVIPMAGLSSRFTEAGYDVPKYMLPLHGRTVFDYAVQSFADFFETTPFLFICRDVLGTADFVQERLNDLGVTNAQVELLTAPTQGQAETVSLGLERAGTPGDTPITIFNIDSFRPGFHMSPAEYDCDGFLEAFIGEGDGWSFVVPSGPDPLAPHGYAKHVVEKDRQSDLCSTGLYYFRKYDQFRAAYAAEQATPSQVLNEHYIAPLYNQLIRRNKTVAYRVVQNDDVIFCGVPAEYEALQQPNPRLRQMFS